MAGKFFVTCLQRRSQVVRKEMFKTSRISSIFVSYSVGIVRRFIFDMGDDLKLILNRKLSIYVLLVASDEEWAEMSKNMHF